MNNSITAAIKASNIDEVKASLEIFQKMEELAARINEMRRDLKGTIRGMTPEGYQELSSIFLTQLGEDTRYLWKDGMSYWRDEE